jgi:succinate dehydrogenase / fumarate reductase cytochrome b subunit
LNWLTKALASSIGKKFVMGITGLLLCGFLVVHLAGNVLMFVGPEAYNHYAEALHSQTILLPLAETGLFALFIAHILLAIATTRGNQAARPIPYSRQESKQDKISLFKPSETWMFASGAVVLAFLILHLVDMKFEARPDLTYTVTQNADSGPEIGPRSDKPDGETVTEVPLKSHFDIALMVLQSPLSAGVYLIGVSFLGFHLSHGFASALQTLGFNHPKYNTCIKWCGLAFAVIICVGFAALPIWANMTR